VKVLGRIGNPGAVEALTGALEDKNASVRRAAAGEVRKIRSRGGADGLTESYEKPPAGA
jgi:HEAT repeat protein